MGGAVAAMGLCCVLPALVAGGALAVVGRLAANAAVIAMGVLVLAATVVVAIRRHRVGASCYPPYPDGDGRSPEASMQLWHVAGRRGRKPAHPPKAAT